MSTGFAPLAACPACGKQAGELIEDKTSRFPFRVTCSARNEEAFESGAACGEPAETKRASGLRRQSG